MPPKQKALEKKELIEAEKERKAAAAKEAADAAYWAEGARDNSKEKAAHEKEAERLRKAQEKAALLAADEESSAKVKTASKTKKKGKDDFDMLNAALASQPKTKAQKEKEEKKKLEEARLKAEADAKAAKEARLAAEQEHIKKMAAKGIIVNHAEELFVPLNNRLEDDEEDALEATGIEGALDVLGVNDGESSTNQKALYYAFYTEQLPIMQAELPGLKLSQYKERIFDMWRTHPSNPRNNA